MKKLLLIAALALCNFAANAQAYGTLPNGVKMYPGNASGSDVITLVLDPAAICLSKGPLPATSDKLRLHSGCNGWTNQVQWDGTPAGGTKTNTEWTLRPDGKWEFMFTPNQYYGTPVTRLDFVLNHGGSAGVSDPWSWEGKNTDSLGACADFKIFIFSASNQDLSTNLLNVRTYPNPFKGATTIDYALNSRQFVTAKVYNALGAEVATLVNDLQEAGSHEVIWNGTNNAGNTVPQGNYVLRVKSGDVVSTHKLVMF